MKAKELLKLIPERLFKELAMETKVDHQVKKLSGEVIFKLVLFSMLNEQKLSLRVMESFLHSARFISFLGEGQSVESRYNSIRDRICTMEVKYFERLFEEVFSIYNRRLGEQHALNRADSTFVSLAAKVFSAGMENGRDAEKRFVKYSIVLKGSLPSSAKVFTTQDYVNDDVALSELLHDTEDLQGEVVVFDRALQSRGAFDRFTSEGKAFITRAKCNTRCRITQTNTLPSVPTGSHITLTKDACGHLLTKREKRSQYPYRIITATVNETQEELCFITNLMEEDPYTIAGWYKDRWHIELFFKFLKQHLNLKHLVCRTDNGIKVMLYMTLILATLILAYKKVNKIKGFKLAKLKFEIDLENEMIQHIITLCGGDPKKAAHLFQDG